MFTKCVNTNSVINLHISIFNKQYRKTIENVLITCIKECLSEGMLSKCHRNERILSSLTIKLDR